MNKKHAYNFIAIASIALSAVTANAFSLTGVVKDEFGYAIENAKAELLNQGLSANTDATGIFMIQSNEAESYSTEAIGFVYYTFKNPLDKDFKNIYGINGKKVNSSVRHLPQGVYYGTTKKSGLSFKTNALKRNALNSTLLVTANGFDSFKISLDNLDTTLSITLKKTEETYAFGFKKQNAPVPTRGCGKELSITKSSSFEFSWSRGTRTIRVDIPDNYDKNKPYRLVFGMHCMGGWAGGVQLEGYYGLKPLDTEKTTIFIAPEGNGNQAPWAESDYILFDELLDMLESNLCIDSSRVFSVGFSYGSMFTNGLSWAHQDVLRGVAVYEVAERNIWLPTHSGKPIAWMGVLGLNDNLCTPEMGRTARDTILAHNGPNGTDVRSEQAIEYPGYGEHVCYNYESVDQRFPVRWCTQNGGHIWDHKDPNATESWVPKATWDFITQF